MSLQDQSQIERTGVAFRPEAILHARERTWQAVHAIAGRIQPGMTEEEALAIANRTIEELGAEKRWHRSWVRFGRNTVKPYGVPSDPGVVLGADDLFFIDIGPVWGGYEGDCGETFATGKNPEMHRCISDSKEIYRLVQERWQSGEMSGQSLYDYAGELAVARGWVLNLHESNGHRLSDFPHALYHRGSIADLEFRPSPLRWVLEIQLRHPDLPFGAFHEDLLV